MSTTTPSSAVLPNPDALHKVFDAEFQNLLTQARQELGDAVSLAPRVAEGAFVRAWDARGRLQTMDQLRQFLRDDVKAASARALSRRAAIATSGGEQISLKTAEHVAAAQSVDPKVSWSHVIAAIHLDPQSAMADKMSAEEYRAETAERLEHATKSGLSGKTALAIGAAIVILALAGVMWVNRMSSELAIANAMSSTNGRVTASGMGQIGKITLGDGTEVTLAPDSKIFVPAEFGQKMRPVKLDGAASFNVAEGDGDFRVYMRNAIITARGTKFVASGRWSDTAVIVKVTEGSVSVRVGKRASTTVGAGSTMLVDANGAVREASSDEAEEAGSWAEGKLTMVNRPLKEVLPQLLRWYNVDVSVRDLSLLEKNATLRTSLDSGSVAVAEVAKSAGLTLVTEGNRTYLVDPAAPKPGARK
ncbi:MAG TPA: FecR domain-containing protein [Gemmatimonadaceae bacterium]|nr:FecR domain-containing protein [Gemmatimonadaceae bacterium]